MGLIIISASFSLISLILLILTPVAVIYENIKYDRDYLKIRGARVIRFNQDELEVGQKILCEDFDDAINTADELKKEGIYTKAEHSGKDFWLEVVRVEAME